MKPGDTLLLANYGDGAEALSFEVTDSIEKLGDRRGVSWHLDRRRVISSYDKYLKARGMGATEWEAGSDPGLSATIHFRERDDDGKGWVWTVVDFKTDRDPGAHAEYARQIELYVQAVTTATGEPARGVLLAV